MDRTMNDPIEQRVKTLELKVEFLENWKNTPFIQVTLPVILSIFLATSWNHFAFSSVEKRFDSIDEKFGQIDEQFNQVDQRFNSIEKRLSKIEEKLGV